MSKENMLTFEEWMSESFRGWNSRYDYYQCKYAETGQDCEMNWDGGEQEEQSDYEEYCNQFESDQKDYCEINGESIEISDFTEELINPTEIDDEFDEFDKLAKDCFDSAGNHNG